MRTDSWKTTFVDIGIVLVSLVVFIIIAGVLGVSAIERSLALQNEAEVAGASRLDQECESEGIVPADCTSLTLDTSESTCDSLTCWKVYGRTISDYGFGGTAVVEQRDDHYVVIDYTRDTRVMPVAIPDPNEYAEHHDVRPGTTPPTGGWLDRP